jgi:hypothetical protein
MEGLFIMTMLVDLSDCSLTLDELVLGLRRSARDRDGGEGSLAGRTAPSESASPSS